MEDARFGEPLLAELGHPWPCRILFLAAPLERAPPDFENVVMEGSDGTAICRHGVVVKVAGKDAAKPSALIGGVSVHVPAQLLFDFRQLHAHAVAAAFPFDQIPRLR